MTPSVGPSKKPLFQPKGGFPTKVISASKPMLKPGGVGGASGPGGLFKKPGMMGLGKKKFQMDVAAPTENELKQIQKVENKLLAPKITIKKMTNNEPGAENRNGMLGIPKAGNNVLSKASLNQMSGTSLNEKRVADNFARPMALQQKT